LRQFINGCASQQGVVFGAPVAISLAAPPPAKTASQGETREKKAEPEKVSQGPSESNAALEALEKLIDPRQVRRIQQRLAQMGLYQGPIDAIIGVLTREAIREYQKKNGAAETGYLTPDQLQALTASSP
jgi:peptidoglycan hydrolase-like protein with peptidoglycan-binding domain